DLKSDFVHPRAPQQYLSANVTAAGGDVDVSFRAHAEIVLFGAHAAAQAQFTDQNAGFPPRTADARMQRPAQYNALIAALPYPRAGRRGIQGGDSQLSRLQPTIRHDLAAIARINLDQGLGRGNTQFPV